MKSIACTECSRLGKLPNKRLIGITINPWPYCRPFIDNRTYHNSALQDQKEIIDVWLQNIFDYYVNKIGLLAHIHWERGARGYIHAHGVISIDSIHSPDYWMPRLCTEVHRQFGKKGIINKYCCLIDNYPNENIYNYVNKENFFPSDSYPKKDIAELLNVSEGL